MSNVCNLPEWPSFSLFREKILLLQASNRYKLKNNFSISCDHFDLCGKTTYGV